MQFGVLDFAILIKHAPNDVIRMSAESLDQESLEIFTIFTTNEFEHWRSSTTYTANTNVY